MTRTRYKVLAPDGVPHFMTCTILNWQPLFAQPSIVAIVIESLKHLHETDKLLLHGYVIMENHLHLIASGPDLSAAMRDFKSYTAYQMIEWLSTHGWKTTLQQLHFYKKSTGRHKSTRSGKKVSIRKRS